MGQRCCLLRWRKLEENLWGNVTSNPQLCPRGSPRASPLTQGSDVSLCLFGQPPESACLPWLRHHLQNALEKAMGRGATVHRAARSRTRPSERTRTLNHKAALMHVPPSPSTSICCEPQGSGLQPRARGDLPVLLPGPYGRVRAPVGITALLTHRAARAPPPQKAPGPQNGCTSLWCGPAAGSLLFHPPSRGTLALLPEQTHLDSSAR